MDNTTEEDIGKSGFIGQKLVSVPPSVEKVFAQNPLTSGLYLVSLGYYPNARGHFMERKRGSDQFILIYCVDGQGVVHINEEKHRLGPNSYFIIPKNTSHKYIASEEAPWSIYWVHYSGSNADRLFNRYNQNKGGLVRNVSFEESRIQLFNHIFETLNEGFQDAKNELANIELLQFISSFIYSTDLAAPSDGMDTISESIKYMKSNLEKSFTVEELASRVNYSISHFSYLFRNKTGSAPVHYFNQLKVQKCCQYLSFTDMSIKEICFILGFSDPYYFSRIFKKMMDVSPSTYRKMYKQ